MNKIVEKIQLSNQVFQFKILKPLIAAEQKPGQFIILQINSNTGERIPLTIADADSTEGTITIVFQAVGKTTHLLSELNVGDRIAHIVGPLGQPSHIEDFGTVVCIGGGIGIAPIYPIVKALKENDNKVISIIGSRSKDLIIFEDKLKKYSDELIICTDDGSYGRKCLVTEPLREICKRNPRPNRVIAIGPSIMMKFCVETTRPYKIKTIVSLNTIMIDGTGMCGGCRVSVGKDAKFVCVDGPEFDGHLVDFDNMMKRLGTYNKFEDEEHSQCHLDLAFKKRVESKR